MVVIRYFADELLDALGYYITYSSTEATDGVGHAEINLSRVRLGGNVVAAGEAGFAAENFVELVDLGPIPVKYLL